MKQIPLVRKNNMLQLWGRINGSVNIQFILDTGCSSTLLSKEVGDILFLKGNLVKSDVCVIRPIPVHFPGAIQSPNEA